MATKGGREKIKLESSAGTGCMAALDAQRFLEQNAA